ncbi:ImcF-related family protein, partial [Herbaspirillum huttiense]|uniref:ImcF-related family protein n=1 Tax=Herbaspirillum huttiense TaxID=863372 RepID=UPI0005849989
MKNNNNVGKAGPAGFFIGLAAAIILSALGIAVWLEGPHQGWSRSTCLIIEIGLVFAFLWVILFVKYFEAVLLWISSLRASRWFASYDSSRHSQVAQENEGERLLGAGERAITLRNILRDRYGWRWRYKERWVLVIGDASIVSRLAPGLAENGYLILAGIVVLYVRQTGDALETDWLDQIRRLRRRRPVDAMVTITHDFNTSFDRDALPQQLTRHTRALRWAAPSYLLNVTNLDRSMTKPDEAIGLTWSSPRVHEDELGSALQNLANRLADAGVVRLSKDTADCYPAELSRHISRFYRPLADLVLETARSGLSKQAIHGLLFAPLFDREDLASLGIVGQSRTSLQADKSQSAAWQAIAAHSRKVGGRRVGFSLSMTMAWATTLLIIFWIGGTMLSGFTNRATIQSAEDTVKQLAVNQHPAMALKNLEDLDRQLDTLEHHHRNGAPWTTRFGLNHDNALLGALWPHYAIAANQILVTPIRQQLEARLLQLASLSDTEIANSGNEKVQAAYDTLKTYLMLGKPERAAAAFLAPQLLATPAPSRPGNATISSGTWEDLRQHTITFFTEHLAAGKLRAAPLDVGLIASARQTIISVRGIQNSTETIYQQILDEADEKYPPLSLATLLGDTSSRGLFNTSSTVPGVFTRAAWDERIAKAIDDASEQRNVSGDWVLSDASTAQAAPSALKTQLRERYFDEYARAWEQFLNSLRWQPASTLSATADQLTLLGDPQRSPLVALMNAIVYQAGTGATAASLSDALISKAQKLVGADEKDPAKQAQPQKPPLSAAFGPILHLTGSDLAASGSTPNKPASQVAATGDLSLARYLERVTAMRLRASQIVSAADPDALARLAAQSVLQGKTSEISDSRDYASRVAASLGEQWAGFGELLRTPFDQTWQVIVQPAASSLNEIWRTAILADWNKTFGGR